MKLKALSGLGLAALLGFAALALAQRPTPVAADQTATGGRLELFDRSGAPAGAGC